MSRISPTAMSASSSCLFFFYVSASQHSCLNSVKQALDAAIAGCEQLKKEGIPFRRPDDYYAEMIKTDSHMAKVQRRLGEEKRRAEASEMAKRQREMRKFGKDVQKVKEDARKNAKNAAIESVKKWRKTHAPGDEFPVELAEEPENPHPAKRQKRERPARGTPLDRSITGDMVRVKKSAKKGGKKPGKRALAGQKKRR